MKVFPVTADEIAKRGVNYTGKLLGIIDSSIWLADDGVTVAAPGADDYTTGAFFSIPAGTLNQKYEITNRISAGGETLERTFAFQLVKKKDR